jgi:hypothetical protein
MFVRHGPDPGDVRGPAAAGNVRAAGLVGHLAGSIEETCTGKLLTAVPITALS